MSKFDPPTPRFDPPTLTPPPMHQHNVQMSPGIEIPPMHYNHEQVPHVGNNIDSNASAIVQKCNKAKTMRVVALCLRGSSLLFSFLSFVILATINGFNEVDHYNYVFAVALISFIYNGFQNGKGVYALVTRKELISHERASASFDFIGDQVIAYMLISASSVGFTLANDARQTAEVIVGYEIIAEKTAAGASMLFFAFLTIVVPTLFSGHELSNTFTCTSK